MLNSIWLNGQELNGGAYQGSAVLASSSAVAAAIPHATLSARPKALGAAVTARATGEIDVSIHIGATLSATATGSDAALVVRRWFGTDARATATPAALLGSSAPLAGTLFATAQAQLVSSYTTLATNATASASVTQAGATRIRVAATASTATATPEAALRMTRGAQTSSTATAAPIAVLDITRAGITIHTLVTDCSATATDDVELDVDKLVYADPAGVATEDAALVRIRALGAELPASGVHEAQVKCTVPLACAVTASAASDGAVSVERQMGSSASAAARIVIPPRMVATRALGAKEACAATVDALPRYSIAVATDVAVSASGIGELDPHKYAAAGLTATATAGVSLFTNIMERAADCRQVLVPREARTVTVAPQPRTIHVHC